MMYGDGYVCQNYGSQGLIHLKEQDGTWVKLMDKIIDGEAYKLELENY